MPHHMIVTGLIAGLAATTSAYATVPDNPNLPGHSAAFICPTDSHVVYPEASHIAYPGGICRFDTDEAATQRRVEYLTPSRAGAIAIPPVLNQPQSAK